MRNHLKLTVAVVSLALLVALALPATATERAFPKPAQYVLHSSPNFLVTVGENQELVT